MIRNYIYFLVIGLVSCGTQKEFSKISDRIVKDYLSPFSEELILTNETSNEGLLAMLNNTYNFLLNKNYDFSPLNFRVRADDTLKMIFSEKNMTFFKSQLNSQATWAKKPYIKQTIINRSDIRKYNNKTIMTLSQPVITRDKKFVLMEHSDFQTRLMVGSYDLIIFIKRKKKWVIYKIIDVRTGIE
jgi:hypothetical protein